MSTMRNPLAGHGTYEPLSELQLEPDGSFVQVARRRTGELALVKFWLRSGLDADQVARRTRAAVNHMVRGFSLHACMCAC